MYEVVHVLPSRHLLPSLEIDFMSSAELKGEITKIRQYSGRSMLEPMANFDPTGLI